MRIDLYNPKAPLQKCGHGSLVHTATDEWYIAHLSARPLPGTTNCVLGRETSLQKVYWTEDGWLRMKAGGTLAQTTTEGMTGISVPDTPQTTIINNDFGDGVIDLHLMSPYGPRTENWASVSERPGWLRISGRQSFFSQFEVSLLASRIDSFKSSISTLVEFNPTHYSQSAGLTLYYDNSNWLFARVYFSETFNSPALAIMKGEKGNKDEFILDRVALPGGKAEIKSVINYDTAQFYYRLSSEESWNTLGSPIDISFMSDEQTGGFTGLMGGIGAWDSYRRQSHADFKYFKLIPENE